MKNFFKGVVCTTLLVGGAAIVAYKLLEKKSSEESKTKPTSLEETENTEKTYINIE